tara:strand:+ start:119 stop:1087 length:969 start_codon:yes stop_codon:yes gene_type:complete
MAKADPKKKDEVNGLGFIAAGQTIKSIGPNYIPSGTSHVGWKDAKKGFHPKRWGRIQSQQWMPKTGQTFAWKRGLGEYSGKFHSQLMTENKRRGWSKGGKTHKNITTRTYKQWTGSSPTSLTKFKGTPDQFKINFPASEARTYFEHNPTKATQRKTTWRTSIKGGKAARAQTGLGRDRFGMTIKETKQYGKGIKYKGNRGVTFDLFGSSKRPVLQPKGTTLFPRDKYAVHYLDKAGNVKGLVQRSSKLGTAVSKLTTPQISAGAKLVGKGAAKLATGLSGVGTAWMVYDAAKAVHNYAGTSGHEKQMKKYKKKGGFSATGGY